MLKNSPWTTTAKDTLTSTKFLLSNLSVIVRTDQFNLFKKIVKPKDTSTVLDVGVTSQELLKDSNMFEKLYPHKGKITAITIEEIKPFKKLYPLIKVVKVGPSQDLPFQDGRFDIVVSWATLEHVGGYKKQAKFINELLRVGKKVFITTPYRGCIYEPHTGFFFLHWLPLKWFRAICRYTGLVFWSRPGNLNPLYVKNIERMKLKRKVKIRIYKTFNLIPTHLILTAQ